MKKVLIMVFVLIIGITFVTTGFAQEKPKAAPPKAEPEKAPAPEKAVPEKPAAPEKPKPKPAGFVGLVKNYDAIGKTLTVQDKKGTVVFDAANPKLKGYKSINEVKAGDKVAVKYTQDGLMITKIAGAKAEKK
jgi:glucose/arabinose dehydrogenase